MDTRGAKKIPKFLREETSTIPLSPWIIGPVVVVLWLAILLAGKRWVFAATRRYLAGRTNWWTDALIEAMSPALTVVVWLTGLALLDGILPLSSRLDNIVDKIIAGAVAFALVIFADRISYRLLARLSLMCVVRALRARHGGHQRALAMRLRR